MPLYTVTGIGSNLTIPHRRTALSATDAIRHKSSMLTGLCHEVVVENGKGGQVDWLTLGLLALRESAAGHERAKHEGYLASAAD
jgi:hypothetical protein